MRRSRLGVVASIAAVVTLSPLASADDYAGTTRQASATFRVQGSDRAAYLVVAVVERFVAPPTTDWAVLSVGIAKCADAACVKFAPARWYAIPLGSGEFEAADDLSRVAVRTRFMGAPLTVAWTTDATTPAPPDVDVYLPVFTSSTGAGRPAASVSASLFGATCRTQGVLREAVVVTGRGYAPRDGQRPPSQPAPAFRRSGSRRPVCPK